MAENTSIAKLQPYNVTKNETQEFEWDLFSTDQRRNGAILLHIIFMAYMSYAGAVVCYYFFVPSIEIITKKVY